MQLELFFLGAVNLKESRDNRETRICCTLRVSLLNYDAGSCVVTADGCREYVFRWTSHKFFDLWSYSDDSGGGDIAEYITETSPRHALATAISLHFEIPRAPEIFAAIDLALPPVPVDAPPCGQCRCRVQCKEKKGPHVGHFCRDCGKWSKWDSVPATDSSALEFRMPFGKHKGEVLRDVPDDYLDWLYENCSNKKIAELARLAYEAKR